MEKMGKARVWRRGDAGGIAEGQTPDSQSGD